MLEERKKSTYYEIYKHQGQNKKLGEEWETLDIKSLEGHYKIVDGMRDIKREPSFKKHLVAKKSGRRVETVIKCITNTYKNFRNESVEERTPFCLLKRGKHHPRNLSKNVITKNLVSQKRTTLII